MGETHASDLLRRLPPAEALERLYELVGRAAVEAAAAELMFPERGRVSRASTRISRLDSLEEATLPGHCHHLLRTARLISGSSPLTGVGVLPPSSSPPSPSQEEEEDLDENDDGARRELTRAHTSDLSGSEEDLEASDAAPPMPRPYGLAAARM